jgi:hypothetical protein
MRRTALALVLLAVAPATALAHPERTTFFPDHTKGSRPALQPTKGEAHVVCKSDSRQRILESWAGKGAKRAKERRRNLRRLKACKFEHIQQAVDAASSGDRILIMPGVYREEPSRAVKLNDPKCMGEGFWEETGDGHGEKPEGQERTAVSQAREQGFVPTYKFQATCPNARNLIAIIGDSLEDPDRVCDQKCGLQLIGTGRKARDVLIEGDRLKKDVIRADRADGIVIYNLTTEEGSFNNIDVVETNGFLIQKVVARWGKNYGVLTFTSDNGLYDKVEAYGNGDSGIYPGSGPEGGCKRYGIEIRNSESRGNVLGLSGTAGNGTWTHNTRFVDNAAGVINDSFASGHPGMPQDCSKWTDNIIASNNFNPFEDSNERYCNSTPFEQRRQDVVCPQFQVPVGTGLALYGANRNIVEDNRIYDNWRSGIRLFYVPATIRGDDEPEKQFDTSNGNRFANNTMGIAPDGSDAFNGVDLVWDEQGIGNCWEGNRAPASRGLTSQPELMPKCGNGGSRSTQPNPETAGREVPCATWDPQENPDPPGCTWFQTPPKPTK